MVTVIVRVPLRIITSLRKLQFYAADISAKLVLHFVEEVKVTLDEAIVVLRYLIFTNSRLSNQVSNGGHHGQELTSSYYC